MANRPDAQPVKVATAIDWLSADRGLVNSDSRRRARRIAGVIFLGAVGFTLGGIILLATGQGAMAIAPFLAMPALLVCGIGLRTAVSIDVIAHGVISIYAALLFGVFMATGGASVGTLIAIPVVPALATLLGSHRSVWFWSVMTVLAIAIVVALTWLDFVFPIQPDLSQVMVAKFFVTIVVVGIVLGVAQLFLGDQQHAEQALLESDQLFKQAARIANLGHNIWDELEDRCIFASEEYARILGVTVNDILTRYNTLATSLELIHPDDREKVLANSAEFEKQKKGYDIKYRIVRPDGVERHVREVVDPIVNHQGRFTQTVGILQDITEQATELEDSERLLQQELTRNLADARRAAQLVKLGTYVWDWKESRLQACSEEYGRIHGMSADEALQTFTNLEADHNYIHPDDRERIVALETEAVAKGQDYTANYRLLLPSGHVCHVREVCEIACDEQGKAIRTLGSVQDVSEQVELESQLHQARKMEAVGQLTSGLAHDFNNILAVVVGNLELAIECTNESSEKREFLLEAMRGAQKGADLNRQLLTFSRQQVLEERVLNINEIIDNMSSLLARTLGEEIEIETVFSKQDCLGKLDAALLESAILNLAINARDAMSGGGQLRIETAIMPAESLPERADSNGEMIRISVSDCGSGMTDEVKNRAVEPFYTTKEVGAGSGLGLSMVYGFVAQTGGRMEIDTELGKGTTIHILLPFAGTRDDIVDTRGPDEVPMAAPGEVILVVEDQQNVRDMVVRQLGSLGYAVLEAEDGNVAVRILKGRESIDLVLSDMVMPGGMGGEEVVSKALEIVSDIKVLFMSGNPARSNGDDSKIQVPLLQKPFRKAELARAIRDCLDGR